MYTHTTTAGNYRVRYLEVRGQPIYFVESESKHKDVEPGGEITEYTKWSVVGSFPCELDTAIAHAKQLERVYEIRRARRNDTVPNIQWRTGDE